MQKNDKPASNLLKVKQLTPEKRRKISTHGHPCYDSTVYGKNIVRKEWAKA